MEQGMMCFAKYRSVKCPGESRCKYVVLYELQLHIMALWNRGTSPQNRSSSSRSTPHSSLNGLNDMSITRPRISRSPLRSTRSITSSSIHPRGRNFESNVNRGGIKGKENELHMEADLPLD